MREQILNNFYLGFTGISVLLAIGGNGKMHDWLFGYMGPENTRPLSSCIYKDIRTRYNTGGQSGYADAEDRS